MAKLKDDPELLRIKNEINYNFLRADNVKDVCPDLSKAYDGIAKANIELLYTHQDILFDNDRKLWKPEKIKPIPKHEAINVFSQSASVRSQIQYPCWVCGQMGIYQYTDTYATFFCYNLPCHSWYEIYKNQLCPQCNYPKLYRYYYDARVMPHVRCVTQYRNCINCSYSTPKTYYWYYD